VPIIKFNASDMLSGDLIPAGWYKAEIVGFVPEPAKKDPSSTNYVPTFKLINKGQATDGREIKTWFNSKLIGMMAPMISAIEEKPLRKIVEEMDNGTFDFDTDSAIGKKLQIKVKNEPYEGKMGHKVDGFAAYDAAPSF